MHEGEAMWTAAKVSAAAAAAGENLDRCLRLAAEVGPELPLPGAGRTAERWELLSAAAAGDLTAARVLEPHADALAILAEARLAALPGVWGVFAAEAPGARLEARQDGNGAWRLSGRKPWCSLGGHLDRALVTALTPAGRRLFAVDLRAPGVTARPGTWVSRGLRAVDSGPVDFDSVPADPVGPTGWYLERPGFSWGGMGVAACWLGGARALVDRLTDALAERPDNALRDLNLGRADLAQWAAERALHAAADEVDEGRATGAAGEMLALRVRGVVAESAERVLTEVGHALGPAPLAFEEVHARRVADLTIYLRQHHAERDVADIGVRRRDGRPAR
jgi:alkylation response protein AidB-like acyl-CoA dehydrogenase